MAGRSLQLSVTGQQQARQALVYKNLTQRAIANDYAICSWATVNKFFNGRPVDRFIFQELCTLLELDWEDVVESGGGEIGSSGGGETVSTPPSPHPPTSPSPSPLLTAVQQNATAAREALTPRILERIPRKVVREKYLRAIARGVDQGLERVIPIIGPAGYGKSTILGDIYDELLQNETPWVGLILCSTLSLSTGYLGYMSYGFVAATMAGMSSGPSQSQRDLVYAALGQSLCGENRSIEAIATELAQRHGRGALLVDTLDLVTNRDFVVIFGALLRHLVSQGVTVVFTCRDHEYNDYLEPISQKLPGLTHSVDRYSVPNFTTAEIRRAAEAFFKKLAPNQPERGRAFADNILALSADNRPLRDILENPLLLALLCDLFASDGTVPPDLTVSKLYQRYWQEKVAYSRADQNSFAPLALEKERLCLHIAQQLFERSQTRLYESFYRDDIGIEMTPGTLAAYNDLLSEGVLAQLATGKLHFFHQTLLEFAIAYWLTRQSAEAQREQLLSQLNASNSNNDKTYWLPVLRQLLAIVDETEFEHMMSQLDINQMGIFGAIAYAAVSRDRPDALRQLLPTALRLGEPHQKRLRQALASAPRQLIENTWDVFLTLLQESEHITASNTVQMIGTLLERWWRSLYSYLGETIRAIAARPLMDNMPNYPNGYDDRAQLLGWLLQPCLSLIQSESDSTVLLPLREHIHVFGHATLAGIIQGHHNATLDEQHNLLQRLIQDPVPRYADVKYALIEFVSHALPRHLQQGHFLLGKTALDVLHNACPERWDVIQINAVGRLAAHDQEIFQQLLQDYLYGVPQHIGRNLNALNESINHGAGIWILPYLHQLEENEEAIAALDFKRLSKLFPRITIKYLSTDTQNALAQWLQPYLQDHAHRLYALLNVLADASPIARQSLEHIVDDLPTDARQKMRHQLLRFQPIETHPPLSTLSKGDQRGLLSVYQQQAKTNPAALKKLLDASLGKSNDAAVYASQNLDEFSNGQLNPDDLIPLLRSPFVGVRVNALDAITRLSRTNPLTSSTLETLCQVLIDENSETVVRYFYNLIAEWVRQQKQTVPSMLNAITTLLTRMITAQKLEGGLGRSVVAMVKAIAQSEAQQVDSAALSQLVHQFLTSIHIIQIDNAESELIDVLCGLHRLNPAFLQEAIDQDCPQLLEKGWIRNISVFIKTIRKLEGPSAPLLDEVIQRYGDRPDIKSLVLEARGA